MFMFVKKFNYNILVTTMALIFSVTGIPIFFLLIHIFYLTPQCFPFFIFNIKMIKIRRRKVLNHLKIKGIY